MLTPYDEYPVHQSSRPFSEVPSTDVAWDDGYYFGAYSARAEAFLFTGLRVSPNTDVIGAYAGLMHRGIQRTARFSRIWRPDFTIAVGPLQYEVLDPLERFRLRLGPNASDLRFELEWSALAPPYEEAHHVATNRGRRTTDQSRFVQCGRPRGWIETGDARIEVGDGWYGSRDRSWGLYASRRPLGDLREWLPPSEPGGSRRALRWWMPFQTDDHVGFLHFHEDESGGRHGLGDVFATPFEGWIDRGGRRIRLLDVEHRATLAPGTRSLREATLTVTDEDGGTWNLELRVATPPWFPLSIGYHQGSWSDGGTIATYHPDDSGVYQEHEALDLSSQPFDHELHGGPTLPGMYGMEHLVDVRSTTPDGTVGTGLAQVELFIEGPYQPYGLV